MNQSIVYATDSILREIVEQRINWPLSCYSYPHVLIAGLLNLISGSIQNSMEIQYCGPICLAGLIYKSQGKQTFCQFFLWHLPGLSELAYLFAEGFFTDIDAFSSYTLMKMTAAHIDIYI